MGCLDTGQLDSLYQRMESLVVLGRVMQGQQSQQQPGVLKVQSGGSSRRAMNLLTIDNEGITQGLAEKVCMARLRGGAHRAWGVGSCEWENQSRGDADQREDSVGWLAGDSCPISHDSQDSPAFSTVCCRGISSGWLVSYSHLSETDSPSWPQSLGLHHLG